MSPSSCTEVLAEALLIISIFGVGDKGGWITYNTENTNEKGVTSVYYMSDPLNLQASDGVLPSIVVANFNLVTNIVLGGHYHIRKMLGYLKAELLM